MCHDGQEIRGILPEERSREFLVEFSLRFSRRATVGSSVMQRNEWKIKQSRGRTIWKTNWQRSGLEICLNLCSASG
jgi:hypothetical protein